MSRKLMLACVASGVVLSACGGGGGGGAPGAGPAAEPNAAIGGWEGTAVGDSQSLSLVVLSSGETWGIVNEESDGESEGESGPVSIFHAPASSTTGSNFAASDARLYVFKGGFYVNSAISATVNATMLDGLLTITGSTEPPIDFKLPKQASHTVQATMTPLMNTWSGVVAATVPVLAGSVSNVKIEADGTLGFNQGTCRVSGTVKTRPGVSVYDVAVKFATATGCADNVDLHGIAELSADGNQLVVSLVTSDREDGALVMLTK